MKWSLSIFCITFTYSLITKFTKEDGTEDVKHFTSGKLVSLNNNCCAFLVLMNNKCRFLNHKLLRSISFFKKDLPIVGAGTICLIRQKKKKHKENLNLKGNVKKSEFEKKTPNFRDENINGENLKIFLK